LLVIGPVLAVLGAAANGALRVTETIRPRFRQLVEQQGEFNPAARSPRLSSGRAFREQLLTGISKTPGDELGTLVVQLGSEQYDRIDRASRAPRDPERQRHEHELVPLFLAAHVRQRLQQRVVQQRYAP
jgi:hypothetical protein